jgi:hypothetical protein
MHELIIYESWPRGIYHNIVKLVPHQAGLGNHRRCNQRAHRRAQRIARLQKTRDLIRALHVPQPRTPRSVDETVAETDEDEHDDEDGEGGMHGEDDVGDEMAEGGDDGDAALAEIDVHLVVDGGGDGVAGEGGEEDEGDDGVGELVVFFYVGEEGLGVV